MHTALYATHPILAVSVLERDARGCWSTSHRPLSCRCGCNPVRTEHDMDAADMPGQYAVSRAPRSHTVHIRFSGPSNVREICPHWTNLGRLSLPEPDEVYATVLPRPRPSQHEPAACGGGRRGDRSRRRRDPGRSDCCDDFTPSPHLWTAVCLWVKPRKKERQRGLWWQNTGRCGECCHKSPSGSSFTWTKIEVSFDAM